MVADTSCKILVTGANGFVGKNLVAELRNRGYENLYLVDKDTPVSVLEEGARVADFVYHLAGVNRPLDESEFMTGNFGLTQQLLDLLKANHNKAPVMLASSTQAVLDNPYGKSKAAGETLLFGYGREQGVPVYVYRFNNLFGKWSQPNYNTVVATFCYNIARGLPVTVNDPTAPVTLNYVDDVVSELISLLAGGGIKEGDFYAVPNVYTITIGQLKETLERFMAMRTDLTVPQLDDGFEKALYSTFISFLPTDKFSYPLDTKADERGAFTEIIRTPDRGQVSVNVIKPGYTKGNHWHHTKMEKFLVVSGQGVVRFRNVEFPEQPIIEYFVNGDNLQVIDVPPGYVHNFENLGDTDLVAFIWVNEPFDINRPDTFFLPV